MANGPLEILHTSELLKLYAGILSELKRRKVTRSTNNPVADYTELVVARALGLDLVRKSTKGYDGIDSSGNRYEIKGRRLTAHNRSRQLSFIRGLKDRHFSYLAGVLYGEDFSVQRACLVPFNIVENVAKFVPSVNGWRVWLRDELWKQEGVTDITATVRAAAEALKGQDN